MKIDRARSVAALACDLIRAALRNPSLDPVGVDPDVLAERALEAAESLVNQVMDRYGFDEEDEENEEFDFDTTPVTSH